MLCREVVQDRRKKDKYMYGMGSGNPTPVVVPAVLGAATLPVTGATSNLLLMVSVAALAAVLGSFITTKIVLKNR